MREKRINIRLFFVLVMIIFHSYGSRKRVFVERASFLKMKKDVYEKQRVKVPLPMACDFERSLSASITPYKVSNFAKKLCVDFKDVFTDIPTFDTLKTITAFLPFYLIGRKVDNDLHSVFYDSEFHRNINQPPKYLKVFLNDLFFPLPFIALGSLALIDKDPYERRTAQIFAVGVFATYLSKTVIKTLRVDAGLRPLNEQFKPTPRVFGGNPSGHTALASFMATYYGLYKGRKYGVVLGLYTGLVGSLAVTTNRHYFSQLIAGAGLGVMFGIAAHKVRLKLDNEMYENKIAFGMTTDLYGLPAFGMTYNF